MQSPKRLCWTKLLASCLPPGHWHYSIEEQESSFWKFSVRDCELPASLRVSICQPDKHRPFLPLSQWCWVLRLFLIIPDGVQPSDFLLQLLYLATETTPCVHVLQVRSPSSLTPESVKGARHGCGPGLQSCNHPWELQLAWGLHWTGRVAPVGTWDFDLWFVYCYGAVYTVLSRVSFSHLHKMLSPWYALYIQHLGWDLHNTCWYGVWPSLVRNQLQQELSTLWPSFWRSCKLPSKDGSELLNLPSLGKKWHTFNSKLIKTQ